MSNFIFILDIVRDLVIYANCVAEMNQINLRIYLYKHHSVFLFDTFNHTVISCE